MEKMVVSMEDKMIANIVVFLILIMAVNMMISLSRLMVKGAEILQIMIINNHLDILGLRLIDPLEIVMFRECLCW